ncbi:MAG: PAC2 family protein [Actinobacteria bacterium]|nr:PAC2 family protein [Actinomycetota bacterium]
MTNSRALYTIEDIETEVPMGLHLVGAISGFTDAGSCMQQVAKHIFDNLEHEVLVTFSNDELLDYRSRRPLMYFEQDHIADYEPASLKLYLVWDEVGNPFLFLNGYEPDFKWEAFVIALLDLINHFEIKDLTWLHSIPFPIPHTRPVGVTVSGNQQSVIDKYSEWKPRTQVPGNVMHLIEFRLSELGFPTTGFVLLVPHYLSDSDFPQAAVTAFELISSHLALVFPTDDLRDDGVAFLRRLQTEIADKPDLARMVEGLEKSFQSEKSSNGMGAVKPRQSEVPDAETIAAELEGYLARHQKNKRDSEEDED